MSRAMVVVSGLISFACLSSTSSWAEETLPSVLREDFSRGADRWEPTDSDAWKVEKVGEKSLYRQFKQSKYEPPHRSPLNISLLKDVHVTDFVLTTKLKSTARDYGHRSLCLFFGYQDPAHFYYVHLGKQTDDHANQIFIVNEAPRTKISLKTTDGTPWDDQWHTVRIKRRIEDGLIEVFFDDMKKPVMVARDKTFLHGRVGIGSFDDTGDWDVVELLGNVRDGDGE